MSFTPADLVDFAAFLIAEPTAFDSQLRFRTAVSRAYYAPLLTLKSRIERIHGVGVFPDNGTHSRIRRALNGTGATHLKDVAKRLGVLAEIRESADYVLDRDDYDVEEVNAAIERGRRLLRDIGSVPDDRLRKLKFD